jgi:hypothetical protein
MTSTHDTTHPTDLSNSIDQPGAPMDHHDDQPHEADEEREPTAAERLAWRRDAVFAGDDALDPDMFPAMKNLSAAFMYDAIPRAIEPTVPEFATLTLDPGLGSDENTKALVAVSEWNTVWEAGQFRRRLFDMDELPKPMADIADLGDINITFLPRTRSRYFEHAPLLHLLPVSTLERYGLPAMRTGIWPFIADYAGIDDLLPDDFETRLSHAWAWTIWRHLNAGSKMAAFTQSDPIKLLAHNLDFWVPAVTATIQDRLRTFDTVDKGIDPDLVGASVTLEDGSVLPGAIIGQPRMGGPLWLGEEEAAKAVMETVDNADTTGRLRDIIDTVRSHRAEDDFSDHWSYAREDFERKLHGKRRKVKVSFIEVPDTTPVQSPESEVIGNLVTNDFLAMLDARNRQIVILLNSGYTSNTEIAGILGYANHSAISKRLDAIRASAAQFFDQS